MTRIKRYAVYLLLGAVAYWLPDTLVQWLQPPKRVWLLLLTFFVPAIVGGTWLLMANKPSHAAYPIGLPLSMLLGLWLFGPPAMALATLPFGGRFLAPDQLGGFLELWAAFPMTTIMMATYSGSLGGVGLASAILLLAALVSGARFILSNGRPGRAPPT